MGEVGLAPVVEGVVQGKAGLLRAYPRECGPKWTVDRTIFEMWLGGSVSPGTAILTGV